MVLVKCVYCGKEYQLGEDENPKDFLCDCGGTLDERRTIADVRRKHGTTMSKKGYQNNYDGMELSVEGQKRDLFSRSYTLIDENDDEFIFRKEVSGLSVWALILIAIFIPFGIIISLFLYLFYKKPKIRVVKKQSVD